MKPEQQFYQTTVRLPTDLFAYLKASAEANRRSVNGEILVRIEASRKEVQQHEPQH